MNADIDILALVSRLRLIESIAIIPRVTSTNELGQRVVTECVENEIPLPSAIIVAREQMSGRGRNSRTWYSPRDKGIWATLFHTRPASEMGLVPLAVGNAVTLFLRETFGLDAKVKWPNDVLVDGRKIAGILIEARTREDEVALLIGIGINVHNLGDDGPPNVTSIAESARLEAIDLDQATVAFIEFLDSSLARPLHSSEILEQWRKLTVHKPGDRIQCVVGGRTVTGAWSGIDDFGRAILREGSEVHEISAGDIIVLS